MTNERDRVISITLSESEWQAFIARQPQPVSGCARRFATRSRTPEPAGRPQDRVAARSRGRQPRNFEHGAPGAAFHRHVRRRAAHNRLHDRQSRGRCRRRASARRVCLVEPIEDVRQVRRARCPALRRRRERDAARLRHPARSRMRRPGRRIPDRVRRKVLQSPARGDPARRDRLCAGFDSASI